MVILVFGIFLALIVGIFLGLKIGKLLRDRYWKEEIVKHRKDAVVRSRAVLKGQFSEQLAPYFPGFNYSPDECKFIGKPIDFLVFNEKEGKIEEIVFVEVKTGKSGLSKKENELKEVIDSKNVRWEEIRLD